MTMINRRFGYTLLMVVTFKYVESEEGIPAIINRRLSGDSYRYLNSGNLTNILICNDDGNFTFIVNERRCVKNEELFNDCSFAFSPEIETTSDSKYRLAVQITKLNGTELKTYSFLNEVINATIVRADSTQQLVTQQFCHITSLEVYRGREKITEISRNGFILTNRGTIEIDHINLTYNISEYEGELYRMNLSCSGEGLPGNGCLFFKMIGRADITNDKFDDIIPGTIFEQSYHLSTTPSDSITIMSSPKPHATPTTTLTFDTNGHLNYHNIAIIICGAAVATLLITVIVLSIILIYCCSANKAKSRQPPTKVTSVNLWCDQRDLLSMRPHGYPNDANMATSHQ